MWRAPLDVEANIWTCQLGVLWRGAFGDGELLAGVLHRYCPLVLFAPLVLELASLLSSPRDGFGVLQSPA